MSRFTFATALTAATAVLAQNVAPPVPLDAQIGLLHFPVTCQIFGFLNQTFETLFTATAPVYAGSGQQIYYTDVTGKIIIPSSIVGLAPLVGATQASAKVTANLRLTNASPTTFKAFDSTLYNISLPSGGEGIVDLPMNGTLPPIGPVTMGTAGIAHRIFLGEVDVSVELQNKAGNNVFGPIGVKCGKQDVDVIIGSVNVDHSHGSAFAPAVGYKPSFPDTPINTESGSFRFPYNCTFGGLGPQNVDLIIGGTIPTYFAPGQQWSLKNVQSFLKIPASLITLAKNTYSNLKSFETTITDFELTVDNCSPSPYNVASTPIVASIDVSGDADNFFVPIPESGSMTVGPFTAGADGQIVSLTAGNSTASVNLIATDGSVLLNLPVSCHVPADLELIGVPITTKVPGNYNSL